MFTGYDGRCHFMNPVHENSWERPELSVCEEDLLALADQNPWWGQYALPKPNLCL